jgi:hypothetical protein
MVLAMAGTSTKTQWPYYNFTFMGAKFDSGSRTERAFAGFGSNPPQATGAAK